MSASNSDTQPISRPILCNRLKPYIILGTGTIGAQLISLASIKFWAIWIGVDGIGLSGALLGGASLLGTIIGFGIATGIMRWGPELITTSKEDEWSKLLASAWWIWRWLAVVGWPIGALLSLDGLLVPGPIDYSTTLALPTIAVCQSGIVILTSEVNARQNIRKLAIISPLGALAQTASTLPLLMLGGIPLIPLALATGSAASLMCTWFIAHPLRQKDPRTTRTPSETRRLLHFGGPWMLAAMGGAGVQSILVIIIAHNLGQQSAGLFRAGTTIAIQYMAILMGVLSQVYAPKIASLRSQVEKLDRLNRRQSFTTVNLIGLACLLLVIFIDPAITLLFSSEFITSKELAVFYLIGMPLRSVSWCIGYVALATAPGYILLIEELFVGAIWLVTATLLMQTKLGIAGAGIGFIAAYATHLASITYISCRWSRISPPWIAIGLSTAWSLLVFLLSHPLQLAPR